jgi:hypothetical protein
MLHYGVRSGCAGNVDEVKAMRLGKTLTAIPFVLAAFSGACGGGRSGGDTTAAAGEAGQIEIDALDYEVTADRYQRWLAAQRALDAIPGLPAPPSLDPSRFAEADVDRAVRYLESDARARAALTRAGISPRDYVLTTLALDQALVASAPSRPATGRSGGGAPSGRPDPQPAGGTTAREAAPRRTQTRFRNLPPSNTELVERNREEIARVRTGMRFRIVKERSDTAAVATTAAPSAPSAVVPAGTTLSLRSDARLCGSTHKPGTRVTGTVTAPVSGPNGAVIPAGASASLSIVGVPRAGAPMELALNSISFDGRTYTAAGTASASRIERVSLGSSSKDAQKVVGGAVAGAVAGQILGKNTKSTVVGAAVGAAAGAAAARATTRSDACLPAGAPIEATLRDALNLRA